ncbi:hypothetical protein CRUP_025036 [Coryphaenoides rupestris]|nr:hypothetical protein CRUP_025036 [Coryphaenoides rupestris]
MQGPPGYHQNL